MGTRSTIPNPSRSGRFGGGLTRLLDDLLDLLGRLWPGQVPSPVPVPVPAPRRPGTGPRHP